MSNLKQDYKILVVDDDRDIAEILAKYLSFYKQFSGVVIASDGVEAMQKLHNQDFDLVITDIVMPRSDGFKLIDNLQRIPKFYKTKIMVVSGHMSRDDCLFAVRRGVRQILVKPFTVRQVLEKCFSILNVGNNPKKDVDLLLRKIAQNVLSYDQENTQSLSKGEITKMVKQYKSTKKE